MKVSGEISPPDQSADSRHRVASEKQNLSLGCRQQRQSFTPMCMMLEFHSLSPQKEHPWVFSCCAKNSLPSFWDILQATHTGAGLSVTEPRCPAVEDILSAASVCFLARLWGSLKKTVLACLVVNTVPLVSGSSSLGLDTACPTRLSVSLSLSLREYLWFWFNFVKFLWTSPEILLFFFLVVSLLIQREVGRYWKAKI